MCSITTTRSPLRVDGVRARPIGAPRRASASIQPGHPRGVRPDDARSRLRGMTWSHPRGYDPMVACSRRWFAENRRRRSNGTSARCRISRHSRSRNSQTSYDLIVIDHPHVGQITAESCLLPLDVPGREDERARACGRHRRRTRYPSYCVAGPPMGLPDRCGNAGAGLAVRIC